jgi:glutathione S-transferase
MPTVIDIPLSPYAQKVKMALLEKGVPFETRIPDMNAPDPEFRRLSPRLEVPALIDGDAALFDSSIIVEYIDERWPEPRLLPSTPLERARVRTLEEICDTAYDAVTWGVAEVTVFKRAEGEEAASILERAKAQIAGLNRRLERDLAGREWFNGERFGFGDVAVYPFVNGAASVGYKPEPGGRLEAWLKVMRKRPSAERLKQDIVSTLGEFMKRPQEIAEGKHKREYRDHRLEWMIRSGGLSAVTRGLERGTIRLSEEFE